MTAFSRSNEQLTLAQQMLQSKTYSGSQAHKHRQKRAKISSPKNANSYLGRSPCMPSYDRSNSKVWLPVVVFLGPKLFWEITGKTGSLSGGNCSRELGSNTIISTNNHTVSVLACSGRAAREVAAAPQQSKTVDSPRLSKVAQHEQILIKHYEKKKSMQLCVAYEMTPNLWPIRLCDTSVDNVENNLLTKYCEVLYHCYPKLWPFL